MSQPTYNQQEFLASCAKGCTKVSVLKDAMIGARIDFNLNTQQRLLTFLSNDGLEQKHFINSKRWENNPNRSEIIMVDAWGFYSGFIHGYIAYFFQPKTKKWVIKSFKKNNEFDQRNLVFKDALSGLKNIH